MPQTKLLAQLPLTGLPEVAKDADGVVGGAVLCHKILHKLGTPLLSGNINHRRKQPLRLQPCGGCTVCVTMQRLFTAVAGPACRQRVGASRKRRHQPLPSPSQSLSSRSTSSCVFRGATTTAPSFSSSCTMPEPTVRLASAQHGRRRHGRRHQRRRQRVSGPGARRLAQARVCTCGNRLASNNAEPGVQALMMAAAVRARVSCCH